VNDSHPWWLWPNVLALDAPAVAVTWQLFLASRAGVAVPLASAAVLALVVWGIYLADRGLDARAGAAAAERHRAAGRHPIVWAAVAAAALGAGLAVALVALPRAQLRAGAAVAAATAVYLAAVHLIRARGCHVRGAKEVAVGGVFAAGVAIPIVAGCAGWAGWLPGATAFAGLCWLNCALIGIWEDAPERGPPLWAAGAAGALAAGAALRAAPAVGLAVGASVAALTALHLTRHGTSVRARRVLADAVLLTPLAASVWP
jgi:hypothetical protein